MRVFFARLFWPLLVTACFALPITAQSYWQSRQQVSVGATYTGPGDIVSFTWWGGFSAYSAATAGTKAANICNVSDAACADVSTNAAGVFIMPLIGGSDCSVVVCTVKTIYDKVGTNDATQATIALRPTLIANALNTSWGMQCAGAVGSGLTTGAGTYTASQPYYMYAIFKTTSTGDLSSFSVTNAGGFSGALMGYTAGPSIRSYAGTTFNTSKALNAMYAFQTVLNGASGINNVDGVETTGNNGTNNISSYPVAFCEPQPFIGTIMEGGFNNSTVSIGNRALLNTNFHARYGGW